MVKTEQKIIASAREVFLQKGLHGARMQEIADKAGINKALLHYYFRSKDQLFYAIFIDALKTISPFLKELFNSDLPLEKRVYQFVDKYYEVLLQNRHLPLFVINEIHQNPEKVLKQINLKNLIDIDALEKQIKSELLLGNIDKKILRQAIVSLISMIIFPFLGQPLIQNILSIPDNEFREFLEERKKIIPVFFISILKSLKNTEYK